MKYFKKIIIIVLSVFIIFSCAYFKTIKEGLTNKNSIVLLGDSVINNSSYVPPGKSVIDILKSKTTNLFNFAKDGATISDLYTQLDQVPLELNRSETYLFISAGGNDILNKHRKLTNNEIQQLFNTYMDFLNALHERLGSVKVNILNLYLPSSADPRFKIYRENVQQWNQLLEENSTKIGRIYNIVDIYPLLTSADDFVKGIEPSVIASPKIANAIYYVD
jgi:hypothetical protein